MAEVVQNNPPTNPPKRNMGPLIGVIIVLVAILGYFLLRNTGDQTVLESNQQSSTTPGESQNNTPASGQTSTPAGQGETPSQVQTRAFTVTAKNFSFTPTEMRVKKGDKVVITFKNSEGVHDFVLDAFNVKTQDLSAGQSAVIEFTADKTGTYEYYCSVGNHRAMGMKGSFIVE